MSARADEVDQAYTVAASRAAQPLRGRLPALKAAQAQTMRKLFDAARGFDADNGIRLRIAAAGALPRELVECEAGSERILIGIVRDEILDPDIGATWSDYQGPARCAAWSLAHERLLSALSDLLGQSLLPRKMLIAGTPAPGLVWLSLSANAQQAQTVGVVALPLAVAQALADALRARATPASAAARIDASLLHEALLLTASGPPLETPDFNGLGLGDVIVLGTRADVLAHLHLRRISPRPERWLASWHDGRAHVRGIAAPGYARSSPVNDTAPASETRETPAAPTALSSAPKIPVALEFELGAVDTSLLELAQIEPGYVFDLPLQLDHAVVTIRSAGRRIGRGELVAVDDTLGVRLIEWSVDGA